MENSLTKRCKELINEHFNFVLDYTLMEMQDSALSLIIARDDLILWCESRLLKPMLKWADAQCIKKKLQVNAVNRRTILKDRIYFIRFGAMSVESFRNCLKLVGNDFFTVEEIGYIILSIVLPNKDNNNHNKFNCNRRMAIHVSIPVSQICCDNSDAFEETIYVKNIERNKTVVGFETWSKVTNICDDKSKKLEFVQTGEKVIFTHPIDFVEGKCSFNVMTKKFKIHFLYAPMDSNVYLPNESKTVMTAILCG